MEAVQRRDPNAGDISDVESEEVEVKNMQGKCFRRILAESSC
jgi:hypothetical protein